MSTIPQPESESLLSIREMREADAKAASELACRIWHEHYVPDIVTTEQIEYMLPRVASEASFDELLKEGRSKIWLLFSGDNLAGYITLHPEESGTWFIDKLYVDSSQQRSGLGVMLLKYSIQKLTPKKLTLRVNRKNTVAVNFYFKHGFNITEANEKDIGGGFVMDDFIMERTL